MQRNKLNIVGVVQKAPLCVSKYHQIKVISARSTFLNPFILFYIVDRYFMIVISKIPVDRINQTNYLSKKAGVVYLFIYLGQALFERRNAGMFLGGERRQMIQLVDYLNNIVLRITGAKHKPYLSIINLIS